MTICAYKILHVWTSFIQISLPTRNRFFHNKSSIVGFFFFYVSSMSNVNNIAIRFHSRCNHKICIARLKSTCARRETRKIIEFIIVQFQFRAEINLFELSPDTNLREFLFSRFRILFVENCVVHSFRCTFDFDKIQITKNTHFPD